MIPITLQSTLWPSLKDAIIKGQATLASLGVTYSFSADCFNEISAWQNSINNYSATLPINGN
jgi:hypothetical protein